MYNLKILPTLSIIITENLKFFSGLFAKENLVLWLGNDLLHAIGFYPRTQPGTDLLPKIAAL